ncbi:MAG: hypothetical protein ACO2ZZ_08925 [Cyclobacteriaceae bacterium]
MLGTNKSYLRLVLVLSSFLFYHFGSSQGLCSLSGVTPLRRGAGFDLGYHQTDQSKKFGFTSVYFGEGHDQVDTKGELIQSIAQDERKEEVAEEGNNFHWKGITAGVNLYRNFALGISLGHRATFHTQQRKDPFQTLGIKGNYYTQYRTENKFDVGLVGIGYMKVYRGWHLLGSAQVSTQRKAVLQLGIAVWVI